MWLNKSIHIVRKHDINLFLKNIDQQELFLLRIFLLNFMDLPLEGEEEEQQQQQQVKVLF
jgi:hypothetical protein